MCTGRDCADILHKHIVALFLLCAMLCMVHAIARFLSLLSQSDIMPKWLDMLLKFFYHATALIVLVFTARCTLVQSAVLRSHVVCLSVTLVNCDHIA